MIFTQFFPRGSPPRLVLPGDCLVTGSCPEDHPPVMVNHLQGNEADTANQIPPRSGSDTPQGIPPPHRDNSMPTRSPARHGLSTYQGMKQHTRPSLTPPCHHSPQDPHRATQRAGDRPDDRQHQPDKETTPEGKQRTPDDAPAIMDYQPTRE